LQAIEASHELALSDGFDAGWCLFMKLRAPAASASNTQALESLGPGSPIYRRTKIDGRIRRGQQSRQALIDSFLTLAADLGRVPTAVELSANAGCSVRSVFEKFPRLEMLASAAVRQLLSLYMIDAYHTFAGCDLPGRIAKTVAIRVGNYERWRPLWWLITSSVERDQDCSLQLSQHERHEFDFIRTVFRPELGLIAQEKRSDIIVSLNLLLGPESWVALRHRRQMTVREASAFWKRCAQLVLCSAIHDS
jgi:hypothetical protein